MKILGIDPGTATTGYGIIETPPSPPLPRHGEGSRACPVLDTGERSNHIRLIEYGCITTPKKDRPEARLLEIHRDLGKIIKKHKPQRIAVESIFFFKNLKTAIAVAQARGVVLLCATQHKIPVLEFTPLQVKMTLTSYGRAHKKQVQYMVKTLLGLKTAPKPDDAADALAIALCAATPALSPPVHSACEADG